MSYTVFMLDEAEHDLWNMHAHVQSQFSESLANKTYQQIRDGILMLEDHPELGTVIPQLAALGMSAFRQMLVMQKNRLVYELDQKNELVYVHLICSERQDYDTVVQRRILRP